MRRGDLVLLKNSAQTPALLISGTSNPDALWLVLTQKEARRVFPDSCTVPGVVVRGTQYLDRHHAKIRAELEAFAESKVGKALIADAKMPTTVRERKGKRTVVRDDAVAPTLGVGRPASTDVPTSLRTIACGDEREHNQHLERYLAVRDPNAAPADLDADAHEVRYLDRLKAANPRYYDVYLYTRIQGHKPADLAALMGISQGAARVLSHRAGQAYDDLRRSFAE